MCLPLVGCRGLGLSLSEGSQRTTNQPPGVSCCAPPTKRRLVSTLERGLVIVHAALGTDLFNVGRASEARCLSILWDNARVHQVARNASQSDQRVEIKVKAAIL